MRGTPRPKAPLSPSRLRRDAFSIFRAAIAAVSPERSLRRHLRVEKRGGRAFLRAGGSLLSLRGVDRVLAVGAGKAAAAMGRAAEEILGPRLSGGLVLTQYGHGVPCRRLEVREAGHPVPDRAGVEATRAMLRLLEGAGPRDLVLCLLSGGGSSLLVAPAPGVSLRDKQRLTDLLLRAGASIGELNAVRKHLSAVKGGQLARRAAPARVVSLILSDVVGDPLDIIASGPTAPDPTTFGEAWGVLERYRLLGKVPAPVRRFLGEGRAGRREETPKPGDPAFRLTRNVVVGNNRGALAAAAARARELGYRTRILTSRLQGEAREAGRLLGGLLREMALSGFPLCLLAGGETTVTVRGRGRGGRNQELALSAALALAGTPRAALLAGGTDGTDGPTDAAGAVVDGETLEKADRMGLDARKCLEENDSHSFFRAVGGLIRTGPTRTNVMDCVVLLAG